MPLCASLSLCAYYVLAYLIRRCFFPTDSSCVISSTLVAFVIPNTPDYDRRRDDRRYLERQGNQNHRRNHRRGYFRREERWEAARDYNWGPDTNTVVAQPEQRKTDDSNRMTSDTQLGNTEKRESSNNRKVYCYYCRKERHYSSQCPVKTNEKQPTINMVTAEVTDVQ